MTNKVIPSVSLNLENPIDLNFSPEKLVRALLALRNVSAGSFSFTFVDDPNMIALHEKFMNDPSTTDILTFNLNTLEEPEADIYICVDEAKRNANRYKQSLDKEIQLLITHGILHALGYTDYDDDSKAIMFKEQDRLLALVEADYEI